MDEGGGISCPHFRVDFIISRLISKFNETF